MKKSQRSSSLSNSIKLSLKNGEIRKPEPILNRIKYNDSVTKKSAYGAYKHLNSNFKHNKHKSYQFEFSSSQITERNKSNISNIKSILDDKFFPRDINKSKNFFNRLLPT